MFEKISQIPSSSGVYIFKTKSWKILYVWKAKNLQKRIKQYFNTDIWVWKQDMVARADDIDFIITQTEEEALLLENNLIKKYQPPYNSLLKGDTWYVYIKIDTKWWEYTFPQIKFTRYKEPDWSIYIWPKPWKKDLKKMLQFLRYIFGFRTCSNTQFKKWKLCSDYTFGLCKWWCVIWKKIKSEENLKKPEENSCECSITNIADNLKHDSFYISEYQNIVNLIVDFFKWNTQPVEELILSEIQKAVNQQNFERAARLRDIYLNIQKFVEKQNVVVDEKVNWYYFLLQKIGNYIALIWVNFFNWKLIDIIKYKDEFDRSLNEYIANLEREFGKLNILEQDETVIFATTATNIEWINLQDVKEFLENQIDSLVINSSFEKQNLLNEILSNIQKQLNLKNFPYKIQALDISHLSWWWASGAIVSFVGWIPFKKWYRKYKIVSSSFSDDYGALKEVLIRRFKLDKKDIDIDTLDLPDLFVIDGGKWQLGVVLDLSSKYPLMSKILEKVDFVSIWKWSSRQRKAKLSWEKEVLYYFDKDFNILEMQVQWNEFKILQKARDEAHRFANKYRQKQMEMEWK